MADSVDSKQVMERLTHRLTTEMSRRSWKASPLSKAAGLNESAVRDILRGRSQNPGIVTISRIAELLDVRPGALFEERPELMIVGHVGTDSQVVSLSGGDTAVEEEASAWEAARPRRRSRAADETDETPTPQHALEALRRNRGMFALEVRTATLEPYAFEGDCIVVESAHREVSRFDLGRPCVCVLASGERKIARIQASDQRGRFDIRSIDGKSLPETVEIVRIHRVICALPPLTA